MEKTIDRTSYRRSARNDVANEKVQYQETTFKFANFIANEVIVSLLIIVIALFAKYFEIILISEETGFAKPSVDIFYEAVKQSGEKIDSVIYVGDNIKTDILPCEKIGMKCVLVDRNICEKNICKIKNLYEIHNVLLNDIGQYNTELSIRSSAQ